MLKSEQINELAAALAKAQGAFKPVKKSRTAIVPMKTGGKFQYNYADLSDIVECSREALSANELALTQSFGDDGLYSVIVHSSGQWIKNWTPMQAAQGNGPQAFGSSLTYARRYGLSTLLGIVAEDDDDGEIAERSEPGKTAGPPPKANGAEKVPGKPPAPSRPTSAPPRPAQADYPPRKEGWEKEPATDAQLKRLWAMANAAGMKRPHLDDFLFRKFGDSLLQQDDEGRESISTALLTKGQIQDVFKELEAKLPKAETKGGER